MNTGDIFAFYNDRLNCWNACQITGFYKDNQGNIKENTPSVLLLDWHNSSKPTTGDFPTLKPFDKNYYNWDMQIHAYAPDFELDKYVHCGNYPPILPCDNIRQHGFNPHGDILRQKTWNNIPSNLREAYKKAYPDNMRTRICENDIPNLFPNFKSFGDFNVYPRLTALELSSYSDELHNHLISNPIIADLTLNGEQASVLDFRGTGLQKIIIGNTSGIKEIFLTDILSELLIWGQAEPDLTVHDPYNGRYFTLHIGDKGRIPRGLDLLSELYISNIKNVDLLYALSNNTELKSLFLHGKLGTVTNLSAISSLKKLEILSTFEIFGFTGKDFPPPEEMPALDFIRMTSAPYEAVQVIKKQYKHIDLDITQARKPEWLAANMDNPFRNWDGDEMIPEGGAKKAFDIYKKTRQNFRSLCLAGVNVQTEGESLCKQYIEVFNKLDSKHAFIDTVFREDIILALEKIISEVVEETGVKIDESQLMAVSDTLRDF